MLVASPSNFRRLKFCDGNQIMENVFRGKKAPTNQLLPVWIGGSRVWGHNGPRRLPLASVQRHLVTFGFLTPPDPACTLHALPPPAASAACRNGTCVILQSGKNPFLFVQG